MKSIELADLQNRFEEILDQVASGTEFLILENGKPLARLIPIRQDQDHRKPGLHPGAIEMAPDFDDPLPDSFWLGDEENRET
jgi:prevent-host-death family protein